MYKEENYEIVDNQRSYAIIRFFLLTQEIWKRLYRAYRLIFAILEFREGEMIFSLSSALPN